LGGSKNPQNLWKGKITGGGDAKRIILLLPIVELIRESQELVFFVVVYNKKRVPQFACDNFYLHTSSGAGKQWKHQQTNNNNNKNNKGKCK
jgi:hypothetical protein